MSINTQQKLAYIRYKSCSTGKPKGVMVEHLNVLRLVSATDKWYQFNQHDIWTMFHSYSFDFSVCEIWGSLLYGGSLVIIPSEIKSSESFLDLLIDEKITVLNQTPSAIKLLMQTDDIFNPQEREKMHF